MLKDHIGLLSHNGDLKEIVLAVTEKGQYQCHSFADLRDLRYFCSRQPCLIVVLTAQKLAEYSDFELLELRGLLDERNILSLVLTRDEDELHHWKRQSWPLSHLLHHPWTPQLVKNKIGTLLAERLLMGRPHIGLITDRAWQRQQMSQALGAYGYSVAPLSGQGDVVGGLLAENPDLILLDLADKNCDGLAVYRAIKDNPFVANIPLFFIAAGSDKHERAQTLDYLNVPKTVDKIKECLEQLKLERSIILKERLTGLYNEIALADLMERQMALAERRHESFCMAMIAFEQQEKIVDIYGQLFLDALMRAFGHFIQAKIRRSDVVAYNGHGKFYILLEGVPRSQATLICHRVLHFFYREMGLGEEGLDDLIPLVHFAIAEYPLDGVSSAHLFEAADSDLKRNLTNHRQDIAL